MKKSLKKVITLLMVVALMASLCVGAMAASSGFDYRPGNKPMDITITDGQTTVSLKEKEGWTNIDAIDTAAIAENIAWTLYCNGMNYQPIIDAYDVYHFVVYSPFVIAIPIIYTDPSFDNGEILVVAFGFDDGSEVDYEIVGPTGVPYKTGKVTIEDNIGRIFLNPGEMAALADGEYSIKLTWGDGSRFFICPFGIRGGRFTVADDGRRKWGGDFPPYDPTVRPGKPTDGGDNGGNGGKSDEHGFDINAFNSQVGAHYNEDTREVTVNIDKYNFTFPTSHFKGNFDISTEPVAPSVPSVDINYGGGSWSVPFSIVNDIATIIGSIHK